MDKLNRFLVALLIMGLAFLVQKERLLSIGGINPNLLLVLALVFAFTEEKLGVIIPLFLATALIIFTWTPFWIFEALAVLLIAFIIYLIKKFFTGNKLADFLIVIFLISGIFYAVIDINHLSLLSFKLIVWEMLYNLILGVIGWLGLRLLGRSLEQPLI